MRKIGLYIFLLSALSVLSSCEGETTWIKQIDNRSNHLMTVTYHDDYAGTDVTKIVDPHTTEVIFYGEKAGGDETAAGCLDFMSDITITLNVGVTLVKDFEDENNWDYSASEKNLGGVVNQTCRFVVDNDDFAQ